MLRFLVALSVIVILAGCASRSPAPQGHAGPTKEPIPADMVVYDLVETRGGSDAWKRVELSASGPAGSWIALFQQDSNQSQSVGFSLDFRTSPGAGPAMAFLRTPHILQKEDETSRFSLSSFFFYADAGEGISKNLVGVSSTAVFIDKLRLQGAFFAASATAPWALNLTLDNNSPGAAKNDPAFVATGNKTQTVQAKSRVQTEGENVVELSGTLGGSGWTLLQLVETGSGNANPALAVRKQFVSFPSGYRYDDFGTRSSPPGDRKMNDFFGSFHDPPGAFETRQFFVGDPVEPKLILIHFYDGRELPAALAGPGFTDGSS